MRTLALSTALFAAACSGGDSIPKSAAGVVTQQQLEACLAGGLQDFIGTLGGLETLFAVAGNPASAAALGVSWSEVSGEDDTYDFELPVDVDQDDVPDLILAGRAVFSSEPAGGFSIGDSVRTTWSVQDSASVAGSADLRFELTPTGILLTGTAQLSEPGGDCSVTFTATEAEPLLLTIEGVWPPIVVQQGSSIIRVAGGFDITLELGGSTLEARAILDPVTREVAVTGALLNGNATAPFSFTLGGGGGGPACAINAGDWLGTWTFELTCRATAPTSEPSTQSVVFTITQSDGGAFAIETRQGAVFGLRNAFGGSAPDADDRVEFIIDYNEQNGVAFREEGTLTLICENNALRMSYESAYRSTNPSSTFPPGVCVGSGTK